MRRSDICIFHRIASESNQLRMERCKLYSQEQCGISDNEVRARRSRGLTSTKQTAYGALQGKLNLSGNSVLLLFTSRFSLIPHHCRDGR